MSILQIKDLHKSYGSIKALQGLSLNIEPGMVYGILGPNGSGKTTTLGIILGVLKYDAGSFSWFDNKYGEKHRLKIGAILETPNFYPYLNAVDNLRIVSNIKKSDPRDNDELLDIVDLTTRSRSKFSTYSLGMKQRLAIAAAMVGEPDVLIFDEPTNGLDPQGIAEVRHILKRIASTGKTVIMASHILDEVEKICSHVGIMKKGKLLASGPIGSILNDNLYGEFAAQDMHKLREALSKIPGITLTPSATNLIECSIDKSLTAEKLNRLLSEQGIFVSHLVVRGQRLEEEFLQITSSH